MGAWGITVRQSDDGLDLLDTIVAEQLRNVNFTVFNVSEAITLLNQTIQEEIEQYKQKPPSKITDFYISKTLMKQLMAGGGVALIGMQLIPLLANLFG